MWKNFRTVCNGTKIKHTKYFLARRQYTLARRDGGIPENLLYPRIPRVQRKVGRFCWRGTDVHERNSQYSRSVRRCCTCTKQSLYTCDTFHVCSAVYLLPRWPLSLPLCSPMLLLAMELQRIAVPWDLEVRPFSWKSEHSFLTTWIWL